MSSIDARIAEDPAAWGWYLYGITRDSSLEGLLARADVSRDHQCEPLQSLDASGLTAIVRPVLLADFSRAALQERVSDQAALEAMVRAHNGVVEAIHERRTMLPAKFGTVYASASDVLAALRDESASLLSQLDALDGCDEWAVHVYADCARTRERLASDEPSVLRLREERRAASLGRAYFLERQVQSEIAAVLRRRLTSAAQTAFDHLAAAAVAAQVTPVGHVATGGEVEILRTACLVKRDAADLFLDEVRGTAGVMEGMRGDATGPWPPYSFATWCQESAT